MKQCFKCGEVKPLSGFYKHPEMSDGHVNKCKECNKKDVRENRANKIDYYREYDKGRSMLPRRVLARDQYQKTESGKVAGNRAKKLWIERNLVKKSASIIICNAVRDGRITKPKACQECGKEKSRIHGHHDDYAKPLEVRWLCPSCHSAWHKEHGEAKNG